MGDAVVDHICICGSGLAFEAGLAALARNLDSSIRITALELQPKEQFDPLYGTVTPPTAFSDFRLWGIEEADLLLETDTSFCYGTSYSNWADHLNWTQSYHLPLSVWDGIELHFHLTHLGLPLEPYLVSAVCGQAGRFAHPPSDPKIPLSRAEYGYQINPASIANLLANKELPENVTRIRGEIESIRAEGETVQSIALTDGNNIEAQFFVDASGPAGLLMEALGNDFRADRTVGFAQYAQECDNLGSALRLVEGRSYGWHSQTHLRGHILTLALCHPDQASEVDGPQADNSAAARGQIDLGSRNEGWRGNCVGLGHTNAILEPLTPAPMMLLFRDIERLMQLIPFTTEMQVEAREFNRLLQDDIEHCDIFARAFYEVANPPDTKFWREAKAKKVSQKLERKLEQFNSRGILVSYDLETFNKEDWTILHYGMKRQPERNHPFLDGVDGQAIRLKLDKMRQSIEQLSLRVPPHARYVNNFIQYLEKHHVR